MPTPPDFDAKIEAVKELVNAKFDGTNAQIAGLAKTMDRVVEAIERQAENNAVLAVLGTRVNHIEEGLGAHRQATTAAFTSHNKRLSAVERRSERTAWKVGGWSTAIAAAGAACVTLVTDNFHNIVSFLSKG
jgi:hypothetical protein